MPKKKNGAENARPVVPDKPAWAPNGHAKPPSWAAQHPGPTQADLLLFAEWPDLGEYDSLDTYPGASARRSLHRPQVLLLTALTGAVGLLCAAVIAMLPEEADAPSRELRKDSSAPAPADLIEPSFSGSPAGATPTTPPKGKGTDWLAESVAGVAGPSPVPEQTAAARKPPPKPTTAAPSKAPSASRRHSVQSINYPGRYWRMVDNRGRLDQIGSGDSAETKSEASFTLVAGLADSRCHSFAVSGGRYLRNQSFSLVADADDGSATFDKDATFCPQRAGYGDTIRLESYNHRGRFIRHRNFRLQLDPYEYSHLYMADTTFRFVKAWG